MRGFICSDYPSGLAAAPTLLSQGAVWCRSFSPVYCQEAGDAWGAEWCIALSKQAPRVTWAAWDKLHPEWITAGSAGWS